MKTEIFDKWKYLSKKLAYPHEYFNSFKDYQKPNNNLSSSVIWKNIIQMMRKKKKSKNYIELFDNKMVKN